MDFAVLDIDHVLGAAELGDLVVGDDLDPLEDHVGRGLDPVEDERREHAVEDDEGRERSEDQDLAGVEVLERLELRVRHRPREDPLVGPEQVHGGEDDAEAGDDGQAPGASATNR